MLLRGVAFGLSGACQASLPPATSHSRMPPSRYPATTRSPAGDHAAEIGSSRGMRSSWWSGRPLVTSNRPMVVPSDWATMAPSGEMAGRAPPGPGNAIVRSTLTRRGIEDPQRVVVGHDHPPAVARQGRRSGPLMLPAAQVLDALAAREVPEPDLGERHTADVLRQSLEAGQAGRHGDLPGRQDVPSIGRHRQGVDRRDAWRPGGRHGPARSAGRAAHPRSARPRSWWSRRRPAGSRRA